MGNRKQTTSDKIRNILKFREIRCVDMARKLDITPQALYARLRADFNWRIKEIRKVAFLLKVNIQDLL